MLDSECFSTFYNTLSSDNNDDNNSNNKIQRRFTNQQIKSLETIFQFESKLEPRKKLQVAKDLGLQPRQVAIWFQNKRARWKSKQLERDYNVLKASYDSLSSKYDILNQENQSLTQQLKRLQEVMEKKEKSCSSVGNSSNSSEENIEHDNGNINVKISNRNDWDDLECDQLLEGDTSNKWLDYWS
ncbi:homeobox-leucine zipper protein ATHB-7-like [Bidens hawaiensis]|uniref:homeobox-leucine zipper protein ATHB-7-like n=1 Tax=Bidens hawaiensis TaxID=980011 RepID=UPI00404B8F08